MKLESTKAPPCGASFGGLEFGNRVQSGLAQVSRTTIACLIVTSLSFAQLAPDAPPFHTQTDLVTVPFQFSRGPQLVADLKPAEVILLEDGVPRSFTIFEAPPGHLTLDIAVMFDVTNPRPDKKTERIGSWDTKTLQDLAGYWSESITRRLLDQHGSIIRFSLYRLDQAKLQRLCPFTRDPKVLSDAFHRLAGSLSGRQGSSQDLDIPWSEGLTVREAALRWEASGHPAQPWSLAGALSVLKDSGAVPSPFGKEGSGTDENVTAHALVIFSTGAEGTSITPEDLANQAIASGVPIYPIALWGLSGFLGQLPYDGYTYEAFKSTDDAGRRSMWGPGGQDQAIFVPGNWTSSKADLPATPYINYPFEILADLTGGLHFESVIHSQPAESDAAGPPRRIAGFSMTGSEAYDILDRVKKHAWAHFGSTYTVGFVPQPSTAPRDHKLEVKLAPKSGGKVTAGKRSATY